MLGEWIDQGSAEGLKIIHITSNYRQSANQCSGSNERIFKMVVRASVHELGPATEDGRIRRKHAIALLSPSSQSSISLAFTASCLLVISIPACISPTVTADT